MQKQEFSDLLLERRKDCDILWVSRQMDPLFPHKLPRSSKYSRRQIIDAVISNSKVEAVIESLARTRNTEKSVIIDEALNIMKEMASKDHLPTVRWMGLLITKALKRILMSIYLNESTLRSMKSQMRISQVQYVYAPSHRSYLDFVLLSYILFSYDMALPNIASGMDFYRMRVVGELLRKTGAFYMRRSFANDQLYKEIFKAYVSSLVVHSDRAIEFFIEGTRSRSQKSVMPKYGLLAIILEVLFQSDVPDIHFIPMSINYDRPLEELLFAYELLGVPKPAESTAGLFKSLSILREPFAHGNIYFNIAAPISAREYMDVATRRKSALSPGEKLPSLVVKHLAHSIIESHKRNTILTSFNLIAVLFNENVGAGYTFDALSEDYRWFQDSLSRTFGAVVCPCEGPRSSPETDVSKSLKTHKDLLVVDALGVLRMKKRHKVIESVDRGNIKGHPFSEETMRIAIPAINLAIYTNPVLAFLAKPGIAMLSLEENTSKDRAKARYSSLRQLLGVEMAFSAEIEDGEFEDALFMLSKENCVVASGSALSFGENRRLRSILCNALSPFVAAVHIACNVILQWDDSTLGEAVEKCVIKECQRRAEELLFARAGMFRHPYILTLDIYASSLTSLLAVDAVWISDGVYRANKELLAAIIPELNKAADNFSLGSYVDIVPSMLPQTSVNVQAKL